MKLILNKEELKLLQDIDIDIELDKEYNSEEIEEILDEIYFNESTNVGYDENLSNKYADLADKIELQRN